jgi:hypothetical protein
MNSTRWVCPHCNHAAFTSPRDSSRSGNVSCDIDSADGPWLTVVSYQACPNPSCKLTSIWLTYGSGRAATGGYVDWNGVCRPIRLRLRPDTYARTIPDYVPSPIQEDYREACSIVELSPKAAATLSRRALQGMIRDFYGVSKPSLAKEIDAIREKIDPLTWQAIDAVRGIGNIGAHMEKDINVIVDVEPDEAVQLIRLIELLIDEWYVARHRRQEGLAAIVTMNSEKQLQRKQGGALRVEAVPEAGSTSNVSDSTIA